MLRLLISVRFHDGRYHGHPDWPPSPARLFQALVAAAAQGNTLAECDRRAFAWLEALEPPVIATPPMRPGQFFKNFVPNNDLDAVGGDPRRVGEIRDGKRIRPILFDVETPLLYVWAFAETPGARETAQHLQAIAERLYQLGRGVDMAWASGEILDDNDAESRLAAHGGVLHRPGGGGAPLKVPFKGSLESLIERHEKTRGRFQTRDESKPTKGEPNRVVASQIFVQPPRPRFQQVGYDSPPVRLLFDLIGKTPAWRLDRIVALTERVRDTAAQRLKAKLPKEADKIHNVIIGRRDADEADKAGRVRITPLPSVGHQFADHAIRRVLVEIPPNCPLRADDLAWAFGVPLIVSDDGEILCELAPASDRGMLDRYGVGVAAAARVWRTVTPAALNWQTAGRRAEVECGAGSAAIQALRHAGVTERPEAVRVQREPFEAKGTRAEDFAPGTRFGPERLWHVEVTFARAMRGPLIFGDGRYLGLGLIAPVRDSWREVIAFSLPEDARVAAADGADLLHAVRRALMALSRDDKGHVPPLFSGHEPDGAPAGTGRHRHVFLGCADLDRDGLIDQLIVAAPWACDRTVHPGRGEAAQFDRVTAALQVVRAGRLGVIHLRPIPEDERLNGPSRGWESHTIYRPTRHAGRGKDAAAALLRDVAIECERRGLPVPEIDLLELFEGPKGGVAARLRLRFAVAITGPILLGRDSHQGGGLFRAIA